MKKMTGWRIVAIGCIAALGAALMTGCGAQKSTVPQAIEPSETMLKATPEKPLIQVWDTELELGVATVEDLVNAGAVFEADSTLQHIEYSENPYMERDLVFDIGATQLFVHVVNPYNKITYLKESVITRAYWNGLQVCGVGGIMLGDTLDDMKKKLGPEFMLIDSEEYQYEASGASMEGNGRVYTYVSRFDDITVRVCVDRNSYTVNVIEESTPKKIITEPKEVPDNKISEIIKNYKKERKGREMSGTLMDAKIKKNEALPSGILSNLGFTRLRVLTLDEIHDGLKFYQNKANYRDSAPASTYLVLEYTATITLNAGSEDKTRQDCYGCIYIPGAYINYKGEIVSDIITQPYLELDGVYSSEDAMLESLFPDSSLGYSLSDYTSMDSTI